ncbi:MAG: polysaccharide deacetylase [Lachnospiraceae bacterium]|nr:polysaccharide deacetylase [Lachnospiraceae bacterium]
MDASEERRQKEHKQRIARLRRIIVASVIVMCLIPTILSIVALAGLGAQKKELREIRLLLEQMSAQETEERTVIRSAVGPTPLAEHTLSQTEEPAVTEEPGEDPYAGMRKVYLTFDDGPSVYTDDILDILARYDVKATFFVNGHEGYEAEYLRIVSEGHSIGMHSYSHDFNKVYNDLDSFAEDLYQNQRLISDITGVDCDLYRFPGGSSNQLHHMDMQRCMEYLDAKGIRYFDWNVSAQDATGVSYTASELVNNVISQVRNLDSDTVVVLMHDAVGKHATVEALPIIIEKLQAMEDTVLLPITEETETVQHVVMREAAD